MSLDYGRIEHYSRRGFGFVSCILQTPQKTSRVFFHIKTIRRKYSQLADRLEGDLDLETGFWYETASTEKGEQVCELWLSVDEMPESKRIEVRNRILETCRKRAWPLPTELAQLAKEALDPADYERLVGDRLRCSEQQRESDAKKQQSFEERCREGALDSCIAPNLPDHSARSAGSTSSSSFIAPDSQVSWWYRQLRMANADPTSKMPPVAGEIETRVVGVTYEGRQRVVALLSIGEQVWLRREPTNPHDRNAIRVEREDGQQIGYLSRQEAAAWASLLDACNGVLPAKVTELPGGHSVFSARGVRIRFSLPASTAQVQLADRDFGDDYGI